MIYPTICRHTDFFFIHEQQYICEYNVQYKYIDVRIASGHNVISQFRDIVSIISRLNENEKRFHSFHYIFDRKKVVKSVLH